MYRLVAPKWPSQANTALVSVWFRMLPNPEATPVGQKAFQALAPGGAIRMTFEVSGQADAGRQIRIIEEHEVGNSEVFALPPKTCMVNFHAQDNTLLASSPFEARRDFYSDGCVIHQFTFAKLSVIDASRLSASVMPIVDWKESAARLERRLVVKLLD
jgi:hypothetical protein